MDDFTVEHLSPASARERGWMGGTRTAECTQARLMLTAALSLVNRVNGACFPEPPPGGEVEGVRNALLVMDRAAALLRRAAAEIDDERLRLRDGWPA